MNKLNSRVGTGVVALAVAGIFAPAPATSAQGTPTRIRVRAVARDAKAIGTGVGGARITITDARTGEVLAEGEQQGKTGETRRIMVEPRERDATVFDTPGTAEYTATLNLDRPRLVEITARAPLDTPDYLYTASKTMLLVPGQDVLGEGILLEVNGFRVTFVDPAAGPFAPGDDIPVTANVVMI